MGWLTRCVAACLGALLPLASVRADTERPNIVYVMADELAYYELSHMGHELIKTPRIDRMAAEGLRFTQALAGAPVCAPLRCALMTGKHMGHASVRANDGGTPLRPEEPTIASMLKELGYATGGFGKWGAGGRGSTGVPEKHGFDVFFGYYDQVHAHSFYPPYLVRNSEEVVLPGNHGGRSGETYSHYEIWREGLDFIRKNRAQPFFCYLPVTPPHGMYDIPDSDPAWAVYKDQPWPAEARRYAAMVTMLDRNVGELLDLLTELGLEEKTIVFFTGDNGGEDRFKSKEHPRGFFGANVNPKTGVAFRGGKRLLYEGGLRIPFIVRWPGRVRAGRVSDLVFYQPDVLPTLAELTGATAPPDIDGLSILPEILGEDVVGRKQAQHEFLYWEYRGQVAVRMGSWKAVLPKSNRAWELYNLKNDVSERHDIASRHPQILAKMRALAKASHEPVRAGTYTDRTAHERDRWAKWGTSGGNRRPGKEARRGPRQSLPDAGLLPRQGWRIVRVSSENAANGRLARAAIDGDAATWWHTQFDPVLAKPPHELVIDLGSIRTIRGVRYLARQDASWNGAFGDCEVQVSSDGETFAAAARTTFKKTRMPQELSFDAVKGRYVRIRVLSEVSGQPWASAAEIGIVGE